MADVPTPANLIASLHRIEGYLGLSHYRGERITADEMRDGAKALDEARRAVARVAELEAAIRYADRWITGDSGADDLLRIMRAHGVLSAAVASVPAETPEEPHDQP